MYKKYIKRFLDIVLAVFALLTLGFPMLLIAAIVRIDLGNPILFGQRRIGRNNKEFKLLKFRSMTNERDSNGVYLPDLDRITNFGRFIRITSIDELPSLLNIIKGDMSIIGPRPLPIRYLSRYSDRQLRRHEVRPGLSCPSVVKGRNNQSWESQFEGDVWYVEHLGLFVDLKSVFDTFRIVLTHQGATACDGDSRGEFIGKATIEDLKTDSEGNFMKIKNSNRP